MTTPTVLTPKQLITKRENSIEEIKRLWSIISAHNVFPNGTKQKYNLGDVYKAIKKEEMTLVRTKFAIQAANFGLKSLKGVPENNSFVSIFTLSQIKERIVKLSKIKTKKGDGESVALTSKFIANEIKGLQLEQKKIENQLEEFNNAIQFSLN